MINNYFQEKGYKLGSLRPQIFLFDRKKTTLYYNDSIVNGISSDDSWLLVGDEVRYNVEVVEDNRYLFKSTLDIIISEHLHKSNINVLKSILRKGWIIGIEDKMGGSYVINPEFNAQITYKYEINDSSDSNSLTITFTFNQNIPCLLYNGVFSPLNKFSDNICEYGIGAVKSLKMGFYEDVHVDIDADKFSVNIDNAIAEIEWLKGTFQYVDEYNGEQFNQTIQFSIPWESYHFQLHYNLLEYIYNKYVVLFQTTNDNSVIVGFPNPLIPSYTISTGENNEPNTVNIVLKAVSSEIPVLMSDNVDIIQLDVPKYDVVESACINGVYCNIVIKDKSGKYYALKGYEDYINKTYDISGYYQTIYDTSYGIKLYNEDIICTNYSCGADFPSTLAFSSVNEVIDIDINAECGLSGTYNPEYCDIVVNNNKLSITNLVEHDYSFTIIDEAENEYVVYVFFKGMDRTAYFNYNVTAEAQELDLTTFFDANDVNHIETILDFVPNRTNTGYIFSIPENETTEPIDYTIKIMYATGQLEVIVIRQDKRYESVIFDGTYQCIDNDLWEMAQKLYGYTPDDITHSDGYYPARIKEYAASECWGDKGYITSKSGEMCAYGKVYEIYDYYNDNQEFQFTKMIATDELCDSSELFEKWELDQNMKVCVNGVVYYQERLYVSQDGSQWIPTEYYRTTDIVADGDNLCDIIDSDNAYALPQYRWVEDEETICLPSSQTNYNCSKVEDSNIQICENGNLYSTKAEYIDMLCNDEWSFVGYQLGSLIESNSEQCKNSGDNLPPENPGGGEGDDTGTTENQTEQYEGNVCGSEIGSAYISNYTYEKYSIYIDGVFKRYEYRNGTYSETCDVTESIDYEFSGTKSQLKINGEWHTFTTSSPISVKLGSLGYSKLTTCQDMFYYSNLTKLIALPTTSGVTDMSGMFYNCSGLKSLDLSILNTSKVTSMQGMFMSCSGLTSLNVSKLNTSNVTNMASMFRSMKSITSLDLSTFDTSKVKYIFSCFSDSSNLKTLNLSNWNLDAATTYSGMFVGCSGLTSITLNNVNDTTKAKILEQLEYANIKDKVTIYPTSGSTGGTENPDTGGTVNPDTGETPTATTDIVFEFTGSTLQYIMNSTSFVATTSPYSASTVTLGINPVENAQAAFIGKTNLTRVTKLPDLSECQSMAYMFNGCSSLIGVYFDTDHNTSNVTNMSYMFYGCSKLATINLDALDTENVTNMSAMFSECTNLFSLSLTKWDVSKVMVMNEMFKNCSKLNSLDLSGWDLSSLTSQSDMFQGCSSLMYITMRGCSSQTKQKIMSALTNAGLQSQVIIEA